MLIPVRPTNHNAGEPSLWPISLASRSYRESKKPSPQGEGFYLPVILFPKLPKSDTYQQTQPKTQQKPGSGIDYPAFLGGGQAGRDATNPPDQSNDRFGVETPIEVDQPVKPLRGSLDSSLWKPPVLYRRFPKAQFP